MEQEREFQLGDLLRRTWYLIRKNWIAMLLVVIVFIAGGLGYGTLRKPKYVASQQAKYMATLDSKQGEVDIYDHTISANMLKTFVDFCDEPVVINRANYYYSEFVNKYSGDKSKLDEMIADYSREDAETVGYKEPVQTIGAYTGVKYFDVNNIGIYAEKVKAGTSPNFNMTISYKDKTPELAQTKARILLFAIAEEANVEKSRRPDYTTSEDDLIIDYKYFEAKISFEDRGYLGTSVDMSKKKIVFMAGLLGVVAAFAVLFIIQLFDRKVRDKEELELMTATNVLSIIPSEGGKD